MEELLSVLQAHPPFREVERALDAGGPCYAEGVWGSAGAYIAAALAARGGRMILSVLPHIQQAEEFVEDVALFSPGAPLFFPAWEAWEEDEIPDAETLSQRLAVLKELSLHPDGKGPGGSAGVIVAPVRAVLQPVPSPWLMAQNALVLRKGVARPPEEITDWLVERDFQSVRQVEVPGEFCRRGGILDVFPYEHCPCSNMRHAHAEVPVFTNAFQELNALFCKFIAFLCTSVIERRVSKVGKRTSFGSPVIQIMSNLYCPEPFLFSTPRPRRNTGPPDCPH